MAAGMEFSPNQGRLKLDLTGYSLLWSSSWPLIRASLISLFGMKTNGLTNTCRISREEVLHCHQRQAQTLGPQVLSGVRPQSRLPSVGAQRLPGWALLLGADLHPHLQLHPSDAFQNRNSCPRPHTLLAILFLPACNGIPRACPSQSCADWAPHPWGMRPARPGLVTTLRKAPKRKRKGVLLLNLTAPPEASTNKGHLIIEFLLWYL